MIPSEGIPILGRSLPLGEGKTALVRESEVFWCTSYVLPHGIMHTICVLLHGMEDVYMGSGLVWYGGGCGGKEFQGLVHVYC